MHLVQIIRLANHFLLPLAICFKPDSLRIQFEQARVKTKHFKKKICQIPCHSSQENNSRMVFNKRTHHETNLHMNDDLYTPT